jgi:hypothetical protein
MAIPVEGHGDDGAGSWVTRWESVEFRAPHDLDPRARVLGPPSGGSIFVGSEEHAHCSESFAARIARIPIPIGLSISMLGHSNGATKPDGHPGVARCGGHDRGGAIADEPRQEFPAGIDREGIADGSKMVGIVAGRGDELDHQ